MEELVMQKEEEEFVSNERGYDNNNYFPDDPVRYATEIDSQLIKSGYKAGKFNVKIPIFKEALSWQVERKPTGEIKLLNGKPVIKKLVKIKYFTGEYEEKLFPLPVELHNDSVTSSILDPQELGLVRMIDGFCYDLALEDVTDPDTDYSTSLQLFAGVKASIVESSKAKGGRMAELAKTQINKGENRSWDYNQSRELEEFNNRKKNKGLFGLGFFGF